MPWFRVEGDFATHPKVLEAGTKAIGLWLLAGTWATHHLTGGHVPTSALRLFDAAPEDIQALLDAGLWEICQATQADPSRDGFCFHDWQIYQPDADEYRALQDERHEAKVRAGRLGGLKRAERASSHAQASQAEVKQAASSSPSKEQAESKPEPEPDISTRAKALVRVEPQREDVERLCGHLALAMEANGTKRPEVTKGWLDAARLMIDKDGRTEEQIHRAIDWCQGDEFWRSNILSMPALRKQYDRLRLQAQRGHRSLDTTEQRVASGLRLATELQQLEETRDGAVGDGESGDQAGGLRPLLGADAYQGGGVA